LSPYTERIDRGEKFAGYTNIPSLQEYVLVHQDVQLVEIFRRSDNWNARLFGSGSLVELSSLHISFPINELYAVLTS
jgi:Uma2 family endonuclease